MTDREMYGKLKPALCKEIVTPLIDPLAFSGLVSVELNQFRRDYSKIGYEKRWNHWKNIFQENQSASSEQENQFNKQYKYCTHC